MKGVDLVAFGAHPDDVEIWCGGTLIKLASAGRRIVVVDLTAGELGTRGNAATRAEEAEEAAKILGIEGRENIGLPDGGVAATPEAERKLAEAIRRLRPRSILVPYWRDRHPDHANGSRLIREAAFLAGLPRYGAEGPPFRPERIFYYMCWTEFEPTFIVDITAEFTRKMAAIRAFRSQFHPGAGRNPETRLTSPETEWMLKSRMAHHGSLIGVRYGEGFLVRDHLRVDDPLELAFRSF